MRFILRGRPSIWWGWRVLTVAPRIVNDVSYVMRINHEIHFAWQAIIWWGWRVLTVAPRIVNDVSYVMRINHEIHFAWQAQYLVRLEGVDCCSAHCKWRFICDADQSCDSFCVAGPVFGEVGGCWLLLRAFELTFHMWCGSIMRFILRGRRSIWWGWRVLTVAPRIVNDVSYVMPVNHEVLCSTG